MAADRRQANVRKGPMNGDTPRHNGPMNEWGTVVHVPDAKVAWTGNFVCAAGLNVLNTYRLHEQAG
jgi:hypothetical protein